jgi:hypothetical protein
LMQSHYDKPTTPRLQFFFYACLYPTNYCYKTITQLQTHRRILSSAFMKR